MPKICTFINDNCKSKKEVCNRESEYYCPVILRGLTYEATTLYLARKI
jgi:hypothetical protein